MDNLPTLPKVTICKLTECPRQTIETNGYLWLFTDAIQLSSASLTSTPNEDLPPVLSVQIQEGSASQQAAI